MEAPKTCADCLHFRQHYVFSHGEYRKIRYGHCVKPRLRKRMSDTPACPLFAPLTPQGEPPRKSNSPNC